MDDPKAYTVREVCELLGISRAMFYKLVKARKLVPRKLGRRTVVPKTALEAFMADLPILDTAS